MFSHPPMPDSTDAHRMNQSFRDLFGLRGPLVGGPRLLLQTMWLIPVAFLVSLPFEFLGRMASCLLGVCHDPNSFGEILGRSRTLVSEPGGLWLEIGTRVLRAVLLVPPQLVITALTMVVLAKVCARQRVDIRGVVRGLGAAGSRLVSLGLVFFCVPTVLTLVPSVALQGQLAEIGAGEDSSGLLVTVLVLTLLVTVGGLCGILAFVLGYLAVAPVLFEQLSALKAVRRVAGLALVRMVPTCATAALVLALPTLIAPILADGAGGSWITLALRHSASAGLALPLAAAMYFVRYLDLRHRRNGYDRHLLAHDIDRL